MSVRFVSCLHLFWPLVFTLVLFILGFDGTSRGGVGANGECKDGQSPEESKKVGLVFDRP